MTSIYDFSAQTLMGDMLEFEDFRGKVLLIVNTASECGLTPQFSGLEWLHQQYKERGLVVIGFPCNQFGGQDPGNDAQIAEFCQVNYGVTFQMMAKIEVNGHDAHPIFDYLKHESKGWLNSTIKWNFTKFLVGRDGKSIKRFSPVIKPAKLTQAIENFLG